MIIIMMTPKAHNLVRGDTQYERQLQNLRELLFRAGSLAEQRQNRGRTEAELPLFFDAVVYLCVNIEIRGAGSGL